MPIKITNLSYDEFEKRLFALIKLIEGARKYIYTDGNNIATIGIGVNVEVDSWRKNILMYKFGILNLDELEKNQTELNTEAKVTNHIHSLAIQANQSMQTLINTSSEEIKNKINEYKKSKGLQANSSQESPKKNVEIIQNLQNDINTILQNNIKIYNNNPENKNNQLNPSMAFELIDDEAKEIKQIISFHNKVSLQNTLSKWGVSYLATLSQIKSTNPQEFIPLFSIYYQSPTRFDNLDKSLSIKDLILLKKALQEKNRFLAWFSIRYYADICRYIIHKKKSTFYPRRIQEAAMFALSNKDSNNSVEYFSTSVDIFSYLNFNLKEANAKEGLNLQDKYTYLSFLQKYFECEKINNKAKDLLTEYDSYHTHNEHYYFYVGKEEFANIKEILSPYLSYLNNLTQKTFTLENIYCIQSFYGVLGANKLDNVATINKILGERFNQDKQNDTKQDTQTNNNIKSNSQDNSKSNDDDKVNDSNNAQTKQDNLTSQTQKPTQILIIYPYATPLPIQIIQPKNTFLTLLIAKNAKIDCANLILNQCELYYLEYDENQEESTENPKIKALKTDSELTLTTKDSNLYEVIHNGIIYYISKNEGILKIASDNRRDEAIELYNFAKENEFKILKNKASQILNIKLKLKEDKNISLSQGGNFNLEITNLLLLDSEGNHLDIAENSIIYLHNCENRRIYENTFIQKNTDNTYRVNFSFDLIQDENSNFFKRTTKLIIATRNLSNDFSTSEIHSKGNVAVVSLSSADKKGGNYIFTKKVSAQEFGEIKTILESTKKEKYQGAKVLAGVKKLRLSGKEWVKEYEDRASIEDLSSPFKENVTDFLKALDEANNETPQAKITYHISSTRRPYERAVLMHYCHKVAYNKITPQQAQQATQKKISQLIGYIQTLMAIIQIKFQEKKHWRWLRLMV